MDVDAFVDAHREDWDRLAALSSRRRLRGDEADELVDLYQRTATHLSVVRSSAPDPALVSRLSTIVGRGRSALTRTSDLWWVGAGHLIRDGFPAALWRLRWWTAGVAAVFLIVSFAAGAWVVDDPAVQGALATPEQTRQLVENDFEAYYSENAASSFAAQVWTNNARIAALCVAFGWTGVAVPWVLWENAIGIGTTGGLMAANGRADLFFGLILPHGAMELTAIFIAGAAGLKVFWSWLAPGAMSRAASFAQETRAMVGVAMGLAVVLLISGVIEAYVTPSPLPTWARISIGFTGLGLLLAYAGYFGRRAYLAGETGDLRADDREDVLPSAA